MRKNKKVLKSTNGLHSPVIKWIETPVILQQKSDGSYAHFGDEVASLAKVSHFLKTEDLPELLKDEKPILDDSLDVYGSAALRVDNLKEDVKDFLQALMLSIVFLKSLPEQFIPSLYQAFIQILEPYSDPVHNNVDISFLDGEKASVERKSKAFFYYRMQRYLSENYFLGVPHTDINNFMPATAEKPTAQLNPNRPFVPAISELTLAKLDLKSYTPEPAVLAGVEKVAINHSASVSIDNDIIAVFEQDENVPIKSSGVPTWLAFSANFGTKLSFNSPTRYETPVPSEEDNLSISSVDEQTPPQPTVEGEVSTRLSLIGNPPPDQTAVSSSRGWWDPSKLLVSKRRVLPNDETPPASVSKRRLGSFVYGNDL